MDYPIGKTYDGGQFPIVAAEFQAYAAATEDDNAAYYGEDAVAPPMFHVRPFIGLMLSMAGDPELSINMLMLVHGEHEMEFVGPLRAGDTLHVHAELMSVDVKASGRVFTFGLFGDVDGERRLSGKTSYFVREPNPPKSDKKKPRAPQDPPPAPSWEAKQPVAGDQATRYAAASGDNNPIHLDVDVAQKAGLPGVILHGLCTMAFAQRDLIVRACAGDPLRLASLGVRFARPVFPGEELTLQVWDQGEGALSFVTLNGAGKPVILNGRATIR